MMKKFSGRKKAGICLIILQVMAILGSIMNGNLANLESLLKHDLLSGIIQIFGFSIVGIIGIILFLTGKPKT